MAGTECASGCMMRGKHLAGCPDGCKGCVPAPPGLGIVVCDRCRDRVAQAVARAPSLVAHMRCMIELGSSDDREFTTGKGCAAPAPLNEAAVADADDLHALICSHAARYAEDRGLSGPSWEGSDVRPMFKRRAFGELVYEPARVVGLTGDGYTATMTVAKWVLTHLDGMLAQEWAPIMIQEACSLVGWMKARWPIVDRPVRLDSRCPACTVRAMVRWVPREPGWPTTIACEACHHVIPEAYYSHYSRMVLQEAQEERMAREKASRAAARQPVEASA